MELKGFEEADPEIFHGKVREMENKDISIPFACCFVMKRIENFVADKCLVDVLMTMIMRIKFTDLTNFIEQEDADKVKTHIRDKLKCRVHEEEGPVINDDSRSGKVTDAKS